MHYTRTDIRQMDKVRRLNLINSVTGIKPANLVGTISASRETNLAIFSSVVHLGSSPAIIGLIVRPDQEVRRHTYENILETGHYTINHVHSSFADRAHYTSAKFAKEESEFSKCGLTEEYIDGFPAPFVRESLLKMGLRLRDDILIPVNGTRLIIGEIEHLILPSDADPEGHLDLEAIDTAGISGLNSYYRLIKFAQFPYARPHELPFK